MKQNLHAERIQILSLSKHTLGRFFLIVALLLSNINDVISAVLKLYFFVYEEISHAQKAQIAPKAQKHKNANKRTKIKNELKKHLRGRQSLFAYLRSYAFFALEENKIKTAEYEFKTALMTSFILPLNITITIDKTHNIYDLI